jgi:uncharacterized protein
MSEQSAPSALQLTPIEARILGALMEKELTTPDYYPLTMNSLMLACNQKSNREPVMNLTLASVGHTVNQLAERELVRIDYGERAHRVLHRVNVALALNRKRLAVVTVLLLRKPQTLNEIRTRTERMAEFEGTEEVLAVLEELMRREPPLVACLPKGPGQREDRYYHTLCGPVEWEPPARAVPALPDLETPAVGRIDELEQRVRQLEEQVAALLARMEG